MIKQEQIKKLALEALSDEFFIVGITVSSTNSIEVTIDGDKGVTIQKCVEVSRHIEQELDRENEDFELSVYSAGLGRPFIVHRQYIKNIGAKVEVVMPNAKPISGIIKSVDETGFDLETTTLEKEEGSKKKVEVIRIQRFTFDSNPEVKNIISFK